uniref:M16 family metallopeptidase n=1 Tax=Thaumasiovibrio occultus TaxID=1891184 RepID=UPI000B3557C1|nr:insulinase family protein [Thaumasiovibrio occultus]
MRKHAIVLTALSLLAGCQSIGNTPYQADPLWQQGTLKNGLRYHLYPLEKEPVSVRMIVHAGSQQETLNQQGYAHLLEHMAFETTANFDDAADYLETNAGVSFGPDVNAYTGYQHTYYQVDLASNVYLDDALLWIADISQHMALKQDEVDTQIAAVLGEFRLRMPDPAPIENQIYDHFISESPLHDLPILGSKASVRNATSAGLSEFYQTWYQPQLIEIVVTGDIEPNAIIAQLHHHFGAWPQGETVKRPLLTLSEPLPTHFYGELLDSEVAQTAILFDRRSQTEATLQNQQAVWRDALFSQLINERLARDLKRSNIATTGQQGGPVEVLNRTVDQYWLGFDENQRKAAEEQLITTLGQLRDHGVSQLELDTKLTYWQHTLESAPANFSRLDSAAHANTQLVNIVKALPTHSPAQHIDNLADFIDDISLKSLNRDLKMYLSSDFRFITAGHDKSTLSNLNQLAQRYQQATSAPATVTSNLNLPEPDTLGNIVSSYSDDFGTRFWVLDNGIEVMYRRLPTAKEQVHAFFTRQGGAQSLPVDLRGASYMMYDVISASGVGALDANAVHDFAQLNGTYVSGFTQPNMHGIEIHSRKTHFADAFKLFHYALVTPKFDTEQTKRVQQEVLASAQSYARSPEQTTASEIAYRLFGDHPVGHQMGPADYEGITSTQLETTFERFFANKADFKLTIVGDLEPENVEQLLRQYVANLPSTTIASTSPEPSFEFDPSTSLPHWRIAANPDQKTVIIYGTASNRNSAWDAKAVFAEDILSGIVQKRVFEEIRNVKELDYSPYVTPMMPDGSSMSRWHLVTSVEVDDEAKAMAALQGIIGKLQEDGVSEQERDAAALRLSNALNDLETHTPDYAYFLSRYWTHNYGYQAVLDRESTVDSVTTEYLNQMLQEAFGDNAQHYTVSVLPK